jgi:peptidoglycan/LPS O-acetylase OafA/YrhL
MTRVQPGPPVGPAVGGAAHQPALDGLRGAAVLAVLLFHAGVLPAGFLGVDLFLALSGYLITDLLLREVEATGTVSLVAFWGRRARRLLPALAVLLAATAVLVRAVGPADVARTTLADGPWVQLNLLNWHLLAESAGYWDRFRPARLFSHLWSIAVEEQFYLVWPVLLVVLARGGGRRAHGRLAVIAAVGAAVSLGLAVALFSAADPTRVHIGTDTRASALLVGAVVATRPVRAALARAADRWAGALSAALTLGIGAAWALGGGLDPAWLFTGGLFAHSLAAALLIGTCVQAPRSVAARVLAWWPLRRVGLLSYGLYLWHWPVFVLFGARDGGGRAVVAGAVSIGLAALSKHLVEDPIRFRARWARGRRGCLAGAAVMIGLTALWWAPAAPAPTPVDVGGLD